MAHIASWLNESFQAKQADKIVEDTLHYLKQRSRVLDKFIPMKTYDTRKFMLYVMQDRLTLASVIAYGAEVPITQLGSFRQITAELFKLGLSYEFDEEKQWEMKEAMEAATAKGIGVQTMMVGNQQVAGANNDLANYLFGTVQKMVQNVSETLDMLTWKGLQFGEINYEDPRSHAKVTLNYKNPNDTSYDHFPAPVYQNDANKSWDLHSTADGVQDLWLATDNYIETNGFAPDAWVMSRKRRSDLLQQEATKKAASAITTFPIGTVSPELLNDVLSRREIPPIITFDEMYEMESTPGATPTRYRFLNPDRFVAMKSMMGERAMGPTLESDGQSGVYVVTREVQKIPPRDAIQGLATAIPMFPNPKLLYSQQVVAS